MDTGNDYGLTICSIVSHEHGPTLKVSTNEQISNEEIEPIVSHDGEIPYVLSHHIIPTNQQHNDICNHGQTLSHAYHPNRHNIWNNQN